MPSGLPPLDLAKLGNLSFEAPDEKRFPALRLAREAGEAGGTLPGVFNAANEVAVEAFLNEQISFSRIWGMGVLLISGLPQVQDHLFGVEVLTEFLARKGELP